MLALQSATHAIRDANEFPDQESPRVKDFEQEYQVFQIVEAEVHKNNKNFMDKFNSMKQLNLPKKKSRRIKGMLMLS
jgi:hypothetical protein